MFTRDDTLNNQQVQIREIIATQIGERDETYGEFTGKTFKSDTEKQHAAKEPSKSLIRRMIQHIEKVADPAIQHHLLDNFNTSSSTDKNNEPIMLESNTNCITRLSFQEFHFYPYEKRGPLSINDFNKFTKQLEQYASTLPQNFHLLIATLPLQDQYKNVYSICIYVEGGKVPKLHTFAKNYPSSADLEYAHTISPLFVGGNQAANLTKKINSIKNSINYKFKESEIIDINMIDDLTNYFSLHKEFTHDSQANTPTSEYQNLINICNELKILASDSETKTSIKKSRLDDFNQAVTQFLTYVERNKNNSVNIMHEQLSKKNLPNTVLTNNQTGHISLNYNGTIHSTTAGGEQFTTIVDICLDHSYGIGLSRYESNISQASNDKSNPIPTKISHIVTSNTVPLSSNHIISRVTTYADVKNPLVIDSLSPIGEDPQIVTLNDTIFGGKVDLRIYSPYLVESLRGHYQIKIDLHNLQVELKKLESAKSQYKTFNSSVEKKILILKEKINLLRQDDLDLTKIDSIAKSFLNYDLEHLSGRPWIADYLHIISARLSEIVAGKSRSDFKNVILSNINMIRGEWDHDIYGKHEKLDSTLNEITTLIERIEKKFQPLSENQHQI